MDISPEKNQTGSTVVVAIATYNRHRELLKLLESLNRMEIDDSLIRHWRVVIIDNSPDFNCRTLLDDHEFRFAHTLCHEPRPGIACARNRAVREADGSDFLAFVDDDEYVEPDWLTQLVRCQARYQSAVVRGPVLSAFEHPTKIWRAYRHNRPRRPTGQHMDTLATGNALLKMDTLRELDGPFDESTALMGGEDSLLGREMIARGHAIVWCDEAVATEVVPPQRTTLVWWLRREMRSGSATTYYALRLNRSWRTYVRRLASSVARFFQGVLRLPLFLLPIRSRFEGPCLMAYGVGSFTGVFGHRFQEYKRKCKK